MMGKWIPTHHHKSVILQKIPFLSTLFHCYPIILCTTTEDHLARTSKTERHKVLEKLIFAAISSDQILLSHKFTFSCGLSLWSGQTFWYHHQPRPISSIFIISCHHHHHHSSTQWSHCASFGFSRNYKSRYFLL